MRFVQISDLLFNPEKDGRTSREIREELIGYLKTQNIIADELLITGNLRHDTNETKGQNDIIKLAYYISSIAETIGIKDMSHVHIVPGDCDKDPTEAKKILSIRRQYDSASGVFDEDGLNEQKKQFSYFYKVCDALYGHSAYWNEKVLHTYRVSNGIVFLCLNTAIMCNGSSDRGNLIIGNDYLDRLLREIDEKHPDLPIIILAHHSPDCFDKSEKLAVENIINKHKKAFLYLSGDAVEPWVRRINECVEITTGCLKHEKGVEKTFLYGNTETQEYVIHHWVNAWEPYSAANERIKQFFPAISKTISIIPEYQKTKIWRRIMNVQDDKNIERSYLCDEFEKTYIYAGKIVEEIKNIFPDYPADKSSFDALWKMTDVFLPDDYDLNPAEVFVLGVSFLVRELWAGLILYDIGIEKIYEQTIWKDTVVSLCRKKNVKCDLNNIDINIRRIATEETLKLLHGKRVETIVTKPWKKNEKGEDKYIINDKKLREGFGRIIGKIELSQEWMVEKVEKDMSIISGLIPELPSVWLVDTLKLACIVRLADKMRINNMNTSMFFMPVQPADLNDSINCIMSKVSQAHMEGNRLAFTSLEPFSADERDAWWYCYDYLKRLDIEIRQIDSALLQKGKKSFGCISVYCIDNLYDFSKQIEVEGWKPIDAKIRATNVAHLVKTLGGEYLYTKNNKMVPLRELIQNGADAIRARRLLENRDDDYGTITISLGWDNNQRYIEVEDDGVGMSSETMTQVILDFGTSFWNSDNMHNEFPGLEQTRFRSTGQFGIGFFSVFMWGNRVKVISNRYGYGKDKTQVLEFVAGVDKRPFLREALEEEYINNGGSRIRVYLSGDSWRLSDNNDSDIINENVIMKWLQENYVSLDCNINVMMNGSECRVIKANEWITMDSLSFFCKILGDDGFSKVKDYFSQYISENMQHIYQGDECVARLCVIPRVNEIWHREVNSSRCVLTVGGFITDEYTDEVVGVVIGKASNASRDKAEMIMSQQSLDTWGISQSQRLMESNYSIEEQNAATIYNIIESKTKMKFVYSKNEGFMNYDELVEKVKKEKRNEYRVLDVYGYGDDWLREAFTNEYEDIIICENQGGWRGNTIHLGKENGVYFYIAKAIAEGLYDLHILNDKAHMVIREERVHKKLRDYLDNKVHASYELNTILQSLYVITVNVIEKG